MNRFLISCVAVFLAMYADSASARQEDNFDWSGLYVGGNIGLGWNNSRWNTGNSYSDIDSDGGFVGGGQIGLNYQVGRVIFGVEGDADTVAIKGTGICPGITHSSCYTKEDGIMSIRGRLGVTMSETSIAYLDGGVAFTDYRFGETSPSSQSFSSSARLGTTFGIGTEFALTDHWFTGLEWNYYGFGSKSGTGVAGLQTSFKEVDEVLVARLGFKF